MINQTQRNVLLGLARMLELAPDFRVGQLMTALASQSEREPGLYDIEDAELEDLVYAMIQSYEKRQSPTLEEQLCFTASAHAP